MADHTERSVIVNADVPDVMAVIADFPRYPDWVSAAREVHVRDRDEAGRGTEVEFVLDAGILADTYVLRYQWAAAGDEVSWELVSSDLQKAQRGRYVLTQQVPGSTKVTYELMVDLLIPMIGQLKRRAEKAITDTALNELKKKVEG